MESDQENLLRIIKGSIMELEHVLGPRMAAKVISGAVPMKFRGASTYEAPQYLTFRVMVAPMLETLGFTDVSSDLNGLRHSPNVVVSITPVNHHLSEPICRLMDAMRRNGIGSGVATDGIRWAKGVFDGRNARVVSIADLRPYYVEVLDRMRFRAAEVHDRTVLSEFAFHFSKRPYSEILTDATSDAS